MDYSKLPDSALLRANEVYRPRGPVPMGRTSWNEAVRAGTAPQPVMRGHRATLYRWADVREYLEKLASGKVS